ncbi:MAG: class I SAM-dependent methyltransferase [Desulfatiglandales bacterium]
MSSPSVGQAQFLGRVFREAVAEYAPRSIAVPGCSAGNGFEHIDPLVTQKVIGIDINPEYLNILRGRFDKRLPGLELVCSDLCEYELEAGGIDLLFCALVLEYLDPATFLAGASRWLSQEGALVVIVQLPSQKSGKVSETPYKSLKRLEPVMSLLDPRRLRHLAKRSGLLETRSRTETLASGKAFFIAYFCRKPCDSRKSAG